MSQNRSSKIVELDVRPILLRNEEPFGVIMDAVKSLNDDDTFVLHATFKPTPLLNVLKMKGLVNKAEKINNDHWKVTFVPESRAQELEGLPETREDEDEPQSKAKGPGTEKQTYFLDNRGLEPPLPMKQTLKKLSTMNPGDTLVIHNDRVPAFLIEELEGLRYPYQVEQQADGSAKVTIQKV